MYGITKVNIQQTKRDATWEIRWRDHRTISSKKLNPRTVVHLKNFADKILRIVRKHQAIFKGCAFGNVIRELVGHKTADGKDPDVGRVDTQVLHHFVGKH